MMTVDWNLVVAQQAQVHVQEESYRWNSLHTEIQKNRLGSVACWKDKSSLDLEMNYPHLEIYLKRHMLSSHDWTALVR